ncbi:ArnT family glycosyltransferase [Kitasatospora sp. LaBMicrA B282]|uniref:ArnT family glycosyltransferase n=1 Tax=Kitasatospora sp. LaBMicrA B282 TaxID=3420949 RepID=UPI003D0F99A0
MRSLLAGLRAAVTAPRLLLVLIAAAAATAYAWQVDNDGLEAYYAAGVRSMATDWHAFLYDAFDPSATTTLDKLPGAFWLQALSVRVFGYSVRAMVLPQLVESVLTVLALYRAVRRTGGTTAALIAAAVLAASPVTIASTRGDLAEPLYLLGLVLAADAVQRAVLTRRRRCLLVAAGWVALAFQAKMTEAWLVLPSLAVALVAGAPAHRLRAGLRAGALALAATGLSLVWVCFFALTPAAERPVVDGSAHNSIFEQVFDYNAGARIGHHTAFGLPPLAPPSPQALAAAARLAAASHGDGRLPPAVASHASWDRLLLGVLAPDCGWLLPLALASAVLLLLLRRRAGPGDRLRTATLLWSTWLLLYGGVFSAAYLVHDYYLATLVPAIAALTGLGLTALWRLAVRAGTGGPTRAARAARYGLPAVLLLQTAWTALLLGDQGPVPAWGVLLIGAGAAAGCAAAAWRAAATDAPTLSAVPLTTPVRTRRRVLLVPAALLTCAVLGVGPLSASGWLLSRSGGPFDTPFAGTGTMARLSPAADAALREGAGDSYGGAVLPEVTPPSWSRLVKSGAAMQRRLQAHGGTLLVFQAPEASPFVMGGVTSIEPVGGFTGNLPYPSVEQLRQLILSGKAPLALMPGDEALAATDPRVQLVKSLCTPDREAAATAGAVLYACQEAG